jgi:hypothetical protein
VGCLLSDRRARNPTSLGPTAMEDVEMVPATETFLRLCHHPSSLLLYRSNGACDGPLRIVR